jgi:hypothetical protein
MTRTRLHLDRTAAKELVGSAISAACRASGVSVSELARCVEVDESHIRRGIGGEKSLPLEMLLAGPERFVSAFLPLLAAARREAGHTPLQPQAEAVHVLIVAAKLSERSSRLTMAAADSHIGDEERAAALRDLAEVERDASQLRVRLDAARAGGSL